MTELKTLKDIHTKAGKFEDSDVDDFKIELKSEVVKWVKEMKLTLKEGLDISRADKMFINFFNLTSEDIENA